VPGSMRILRWKCWRSGNHLTHPRLLIVEKIFAHFLDAGTLLVLTVGISLGLVVY